MQRLAGCGLDTVYRWIKMLEPAWRSGRGRAARVPPMPRCHGLELAPIQHAPLPVNYAGPGLPDPGRVRCGRQAYPLPLGLRDQL